MSNKQSMIGLTILAAGLVILLGKLGVFAFIGNIFWPLLILVPGVLLHLLYFGRMLTSAVALIPAGVLTVYGLLFFVCNLGGWKLLVWLWPVFIAGPAVGLYEYSVFGPNRDRTLRMIAVGLIALSALLLLIGLFRSAFIYLLAAALILAGAWMAWGRRARW
ncbi:MAG: hypothetical protein A9Z00_06175 [Thermobacillus sp. ZCTH02-B1]|uniref:hypothetical protein n=1 Tax=Thermobacillus sp. ZCTH02-B1 TaxID=1858795 RepID=UPI000B5835F5|nr:hypothetical protein [Thermobacillus sp. ZCTH02-B1]OUM95949.1 MAG: hypothetical protein A9Z00_06175 [Thermobacillus sp. ZCTH02-B1]